MPAAEPSAMRVWRRGMSVFHKTIEPREVEALAALRDGGTFERMCEIVTGDGNEEMGAEAAFAMLRSWLADEVLVNLLVGGAVALVRPAHLQPSSGYSFD